MLGNARDSAGGHGTPPTTHEVILDLLASAGDLLRLATRLNDKPDEWWSISHVTKSERPPMALPTEDEIEVSL